jgi:N-acetyl-anhydromuramyl-L-alanine amidase AmpD
MKDGAVEPTFRWEEQLHGAHSGDPLFNARGIGICLIGNFEKTPPSKAQVTAVKELVKALAGRHQIVREKIIGHASVKATACPGKHFPLQDVRAAVP